jgi:hypothetical protein
MKMTNETPCVVVPNVGGETYILCKSEIIGIRIVDGRDVAFILTNGDEIVLFENKKDCVEDEIKVERMLIPQLCTELGFEFVVNTANIVNEIFEYPDGFEDDYEDDEND